MRIGHVAVASVLAAGFVHTGVAQAGKFKTLASFCDTCAGGANPVSRLVMDASGRLYGTSSSGGSDAVFEVVPNAKQTRWKLNTVFAFPVDCGADGCEPFGNLIIDKDGDLYGTTFEGGANMTGSVFELMPNARHTKWKFKTIYNFDFGAVDPFAGLTYQGASSGMPYDGTSPLYGTSDYGGTQGDGTVYQLTRKGGTWTETVLYSFCTQASCADGSNPRAQLLLDQNGNFFGTATGGGANGAGVVFEITGIEGGWTETVLHDFCAAQNCADGSMPDRGVVADPSGNLYGTATGGGAHNAGVLFKLVPNGTRSTYSVLYNFCSLSNCKDGSDPEADLLLDSSGNLFGTTAAGGGAANGGTAFELSGTALQVLHSFCSKDACADGAQPVGGVINDAAGRLFGATVAGGAHGQGTAFELSF